ncbi:MAG: hypothetical protein V4550_03975 [Gemmatimonadota bacterium]
MHRSKLVCLLILLSAEAGAQIIRPRYQLREPTASASLGMGFQQGWSVSDGSTNSTWDFGSANPWVASLEKHISSGVSLGVRGTTASVPLRYQRVNGGDGSLSTDADANVSQLFGVLHVANGTGFHSVLELSAGATMYSNFRARPDAFPLNPGSQDFDFTFAFGYGLGYSLSPRFSIDVVQDVMTMIHQTTGLDAGANNSVRVQQTRVVGRFGLGG